MTFLSTVTKMIEEYPELFPTRLEAMDHLLNVIGNGYEWVNGELVESYVMSPEEKAYNDKRHQDHIDEMLKAAQALPDAGFMKEWLLDYARAENARANAATVAATKVETLVDDRTFYPLCEYSAIRRVPLDVKPDWAEAIAEMTEILAKHGIAV